MTTTLKPVHETIHYIRGITFKPEDKVDTTASDAVICMRTKNIQDVLDQSDLIAVPEAFVRRQELYLKAGDILISSANSWNLVGKCCQVPQLPYRATAGGFISIIRPKSAVDPRFLFRWLTYPPTQALIRRCARQTTNIANLSVDQFEALEMPVPPLPEQRRIADILDKADALRRKRKEAIALTEELLRSAFLETVGPGASGYASWNEQSIESLALDRPNSMRTGPFGSDLRHSEFVDEGVAVLGIDNAVRNRFAWGERRFITPERYERLSRYTVFPDDVIVTIMGTTGRSAVVPADIPTAITTKHLATITLDRAKAEPEFVSQALFRHPDALRQIAAAGRGAIMTGLNLGLIKSLRLRIPPIERQRSFTKLTAHIRSLTRRLETASDTADELFRSIVDRTFQQDG